MKSSSVLLLLFSSALALASPLVSRGHGHKDKVLGTSLKGSTAPVAHSGDIAPPPPQNSTTTARDVVHARDNNYDWIQWSTGYTWPEGTPVGGDSVLTIYSSGYAEFKTHFHDSGWPSWDVYDTCILHDLAGRAYTFESSGRMHGTDEAGSRDFDYDVTNYYWNIQEYWYDIENGNLLLDCNAYIN